MGLYNETPGRHRTLSQTLAASAIGLVFALLLSSCATNHAYRKASLVWDGQSIFERSRACDAGFALTDDLIATEMQLSDDATVLASLKNKNSTNSSRKKLNAKIRAIINAQLAADDQASPCWTASYEDHHLLVRNAGATSSKALVQAPNYDLFYAEFDDQGERADVAHDAVPFERSEVALIEHGLTSLLRQEADPRVGGGLNIVLFTHGWHGSAQATNDYSLWFKAILEQIAFQERSSRRTACRLAHFQLDSGIRAAKDALTRAQDPHLECIPSDSGPAFRERRTVGIEIAWRGDSFNMPYLTFANFWDRKGAAQTVARGAVSDLMARLQKFYLLNSCEGSDSPTEKTGTCDTVHMLTIGHSFGALIDYHSLSDNITTGVLADRNKRAHGFGDMTVLLNPAFEGERETTLIETSVHHDPYPTAAKAALSEQLQQSGQWPSTAQIPTLVALQSEGDWATHYAFPAARFFTGLLENTSGTGEYLRSLQATGWVDQFYSHHLNSGTANGKDVCAPENTALDWYCPFDLEHEQDVLHPLRLFKAGPNVGALAWPAFAPLWTVHVDSSIMKDHDDIADPAVVRFIALLFRAAYEQEELISYRRQKDSH